MDVEWTPRESMILIKANCRPTKNYVVSHVFLSVRNTHAFICETSHRKNTIIENDNLFSLHNSSLSFISNQHGTGVILIKWTSNLYSVIPYNCGHIKKKSKFSFNWSFQSQRDQLHKQNITILIQQLFPEFSFVKLVYFLLDRNGNRIFVVMEGDKSLLYIEFNLNNMALFYLFLPNNTVLILPTDHLFPQKVMVDNIVYIISKVTDSTKLLKDVMAYSTASNASRLCTFNDWTRCAVSTDALLLAIRYRQLDTIDFYLQSLLLESLGDSNDYSAHEKTITIIMSEAQLLLSNNDTRQYARQIFSLVSFFLTTYMDRWKLHGNSWLHHTLYKLQSIVYDGYFTKKLSANPESHLHVGASDFDGVSDDASFSQSVIGALQVNQAAHCQNMLQVHRQSAFSAGLIRNFSLLTAMDELRSSRNFLLAKQLLRAIGCNYMEEMENISLHTPELQLRDTIASSILSECSPNFRQLMHSVHAIESLYSCRSYATAKELVCDMCNRNTNLVIISDDILRIKDICKERCNEEIINAETHLYSYLKLRWAQCFNTNHFERLRLDAQLLKSSSDTSVDFDLFDNVHCVQYLCDHLLVDLIQQVLSRNPSSIMLDLISHCSQFMPWHVQMSLLDVISDNQSLLLSQPPHVQTVFISRRDTPNVANCVIQKLVLSAIDYLLHIRCYFGMFALFRTFSRWTDNIGSTDDSSYFYDLLENGLRFCLAPTIEEFRRLCLLTSGITEHQISDPRLSRKFMSADILHEMLSTGRLCTCMQSAVSIDEPCDELGAAILASIRHTTESCSSLALTLYQLLDEGTELKCLQVLSLQSVYFTSRTPSFSLGNHVGSYSEKLLYRYYLVRHRPCFAAAELFSEALQDEESYGSTASEAKLCVSSMKDTPELRSCFCVFSYFTGDPCIVRKCMVELCANQLINFVRNITVDDEQESPECPTLSQPLSRANLISNIDYCIDIISRNHLSLNNHLGVRYALENFSLCQCVNSMSGVSQSPDGILKFASQSGDWLLFLSAAQLFCLQKHQVRQYLAAFNIGLREHISYVIDKAMSVDSAANLCGSLRSNTSSHTGQSTALSAQHLDHEQHGWPTLSLLDIKQAAPLSTLDLLFNAQTDSFPSNCLLSNCLALDYPLLSVMAACLGRSALDCIGCYIIASLPAEYSTTLKASWNNKAFTTWSWGTLRELFSMLVEIGLSQLAACACEIFLRQCLPLGSFFRYIACVVDVFDGNQQTEWLRAALAEYENCAVNASAESDDWKATNTVIQDCIGLAWSKCAHRWGADALVCVFDEWLEHEASTKFMLNGTEVSLMRSCFDEISRCSGFGGCDISEISCSGHDFEITMMQCAQKLSADGESNTAKNIMDLLSVVDEHDAQPVVDTECDLAMEYTEWQDIVVRCSSHKSTTRRDTQLEGWRDEYMYTCSPECKPPLVAISTRVVHCLECPYMASRIDQLIDDERVCDAATLAWHHSHSHSDLNLILAAIELAMNICDYHEVDMMLTRMESTDPNSRPLGIGNRRRSFVTMHTVPQIKKVRTSATLGQSTDDLDNNLELIAKMIDFTLSSGAHRMLQNIYLLSKVAVALDTSYELLVRSDEFESLTRILAGSSTDKVQLSLSYSKAARISSDAMAAFVAGICIGYLHHECKSTLDLAVTITPMQQKIIKTMSTSRGHSAAHVSMYSSVIGLHDVANITEFSVPVGNVLLDAIRDGMTELEGRPAATPPCEVSSDFHFLVELLILAHNQFTKAGDTERISVILRNAKRLVWDLAGADLFSLIMRLYLGVGRYGEMVYVIDILNETNKIELLFKEGSNKNEKLKMVVVDYMRRNECDEVNLHMTYTSFVMFRQLGLTFEESAREAIRGWKRHLTDSGGGAQKRDLLDVAASDYLSAVESYYRDKCWQRAESCFRSAQLCVLQSKLANRKRVVDVDAAAVKSFMRHHDVFYESFIVMCCYDVNMWPELFVHQVLLSQNMEYRNSLIQYNLVSRLMAPMWLSEASRNNVSLSNEMRTLIVHFLEQIG